MKMHDHSRESCAHTFRKILNTQFVENNISSKKRLISLHKTGWLPCSHLSLFQDQRFHKLPNNFHLHFFLFQFDKIQALANDSSSRGLVLFIPSSKLLGVICRYISVLPNISMRLLCNCHSILVFKEKASQLATSFAVNQ